MGKGAVFLGIVFAARSADDLGIARHLPGAEPTVQRRQDLAFGQIASPAKNHQVEGIDRYHA